MDIIMARIKHQLPECIELHDARMQAAKLIAIACDAIESAYGGWIPACDINKAVRRAVRRAMTSAGDCEPWQKAEMELSLTEIITDHVYNTMVVH